MQFMRIRCPIIKIVIPEEFPINFVYISINKFGKFEPTILDLSRTTLPTMDNASAFYPTSFSINSDLVDSKSTAFSCICQYLCPRDLSIYWYGI